MIMRGFWGVSMWLYAFGLPVLLPASLQYSFPAAPKILQAPVGASAPEGQHLGVPPAPQPPTAPLPWRRLCISQTSLRGSLALPLEPLLVMREDGLGQLPPLPGLLRGSVGQHSTSGAAGSAGPALVSMHQQVVGGRHERVGMGMCGKRDRNGRDP